MNIFSTVDVEIWPDSWNRLDERSQELSAAISTIRQGGRLWPSYDPSDPQ
ncbi:hypothetical protein [Nitrosococcus oceani]|nr:hypothetical protein [Nitrosococcus oceani]